MTGPDAWITRAAAGDPLDLIAADDHVPEWMVDVAVRAAAYSLVFPQVSPVTTPVAAGTMDDKCPGVVGSDPGRDQKPLGRP